MQQEEKIESFYFPMMVSEFSEEEDSDEKILKRWELFDSLSETKKETLISENIALEIKKICQLFSFTQEVAEEVSRIVRDLFFEKIKSDELKKHISKRIQGLPENKKETLLLMVQKKILNIENYDKAQFEKMSLKDALKKYENLGEQLITSKHIKLRNFPEPVRPSLKNWLSDYNFNTGFGIHDAMVRGTYLFQNENAKKLDTLDRQKLAFALKNYDENSPVEINISLAQMIFPKFEIIRPDAPPLSPRIEKPKSFMLEKEKEAPNLDFSKKTSTENKISFSSSHKFPFESQNVAKDNPAKSSVQAPEEPQPLRINPRGFRARPDNLKNEKLSSKNVVNLKE